MRGRKLSICALVAIMSGCYHVTVVTGLPESTTTYDEEFQMSFVAGLVPPPEIEAEEEGCTEGCREGPCLAQLREYSGWGDQRKPSHAHLCVRDVRRLIPRRG